MCVEIRSCGVDLHDVNIVYSPFPFGNDAEQLTGDTILPYFGKKKQVTYHPNLSYWCFHISPNVLFFQAKYYA